jgi:hypothetical protein
MATATGILEVRGLGKHKMSELAAQAKHSAPMIREKNGKKPVGEKK